jgi:hypothetical protein
LLEDFSFSTKKAVAKAIASFFLATQACSQRRQGPQNADFLNLRSVGLVGKLFAAMRKRVGAFSVMVLTVAQSTLLSHPGRKERG